MSLNSSEGQDVSTDHISSTYLNLRLRCNYFRFGKKKRPPYCNFSFRLLLPPYRSNRRAIPHQATKFRPNRANLCGVITSYTISRWRERWLHITSEFILVVISLSSEDRILLETQILSTSFFSCQFLSANQIS